jgi:pimeloyl-ACP methyl ester carboxylesterase
MLSLISPSTSRHVRSRVLVIASGLLVLTLFGAPNLSAAKSAAARQQTSKPTIVLVHGAWADSGSWSKEVRALQGDGYTVVVPPNPLRGLPADAAYLADFLQTIPGPIVLVGHSYGGAVITNAATGNPNVKALVFVDAFIPDINETVLGLASTPPPPGQSASCLGGDPTNVFNFVPYPGAPTGDADLYVKSVPNPSFIGFSACFANDLPSSTAAVLAATQRPIAFSALVEPSGTPAWKTIPSWAVVGTVDRVIPPYAQLAMAQRAKAHITEVAGSHLALISHADVVTSVIETAANATN